VRRVGLAKQKSRTPSIPAARLRDRREQTLNRLPADQIDGGVGDAWFMNVMLGASNRLALIKREKET